MERYLIFLGGLVGCCASYCLGVIIGERDGRSDLEHELRLRGHTVAHVAICSRCSHITDLGLASIPRTEGEA